MADPTDTTAVVTNIVSKRLMETIVELDFRFTIGDCVAHHGQASLDTIQDELYLLAERTGASVQVIPRRDGHPEKDHRTLDVREGGEGGGQNNYEDIILFEFPRDFPKRLRLFTLRERVQALSDRCLAWLLFAASTAFAMLLILSLALVGGLLSLVVLIQACSGNNGRGSSHPFSHHRIPHIGFGHHAFWPSDFFLMFLCWRNNFRGPVWLWWLPGAGLALTGRQRDRIRRRRLGRAVITNGVLSYEPNPAPVWFPSEDSNTPTVLQVVISYVFGEGNPNAGHEDKEVAAIAQLARQCHGVLAPHQIAPFLDSYLLSDDIETPVSSQAYIMRALNYLGGHVSASDDGQLIYVFPVFQSTAANNADSGQAISPPINEHGWKFSGNRGTEDSWCTFAGVVNLILLFLLHHVAAGLRDGTQFAPPWLRFLVLLIDKYLVPVFVIHGLLFLFIPLVRSLWIKSANKNVAARNGKRLSRVREVVSSYVTTTPSRALTDAKEAHQSLAIV